MRRGHRVLPHGNGVTLHHTYAGDRFHRVAELAIEHKPQASYEARINALHHYSE